MTKITKSILKLILPLGSLGFFLVASILVLIVSQGRMFVDDGSIVQTGIIRLTSIPNQELRAFINGEPVALIESRITNVNPGNVTLKLEKDGYTPWEKLIRVEPGIVRDVFAQLYPNTIPFEKVTTQNIDISVSTMDGQFIFFTVLDPVANSGIWRVRLNRNILDFSNSQQIVQVVKFTENELSELKQGSYSLKVSSDNSRLILQTANKSYLYNFNTNPQKVDLEIAIGLNPVNPIWYRGSESIIFFKDDYYAFEYNINNDTISLIEYNPSGLNNFAISDNRVLYIKNNTLLNYTGGSSKPFNFSEKLLPLIPSVLTEVYTPRSNPNVVILKSNETLFYIDLQKDFLDIIDTSAEIYKVPDNGRVIVYQKNGVLFSYFVEDNLEPNTLTTQNYSLNLSVDTIDNLEFTSSGKNLVIFEDNKLTLMDYDGLNSKQILSDFVFIENNVTFANNGTEIYGLVEEKNSLAENERNIYKFELNLE